MSAANCALRYLDINRDGALSSTEITYAFNRYLNAMQRAVAPTEAQFLANCDMNNDKMITMQEFVATPTTCLATCMRIGQMIQFICIPAQKAYRDRTGHNRDVVQPDGLILPEIDFSLLAKDTGSLQKRVVPESSKKKPKLHKLPQMPAVKTPAEIDAEEQRRSLILTE